MSEEQLIDVTRFEDLTVEEKSKLSEDRIKNYVSIEGAIAGITPVPEPAPFQFEGDTEFEPGESEEIAAVNLDGRYGSFIYIKDMEKAKEFADCEGFTLSTQTINGKDYHYATPAEITVFSRKVYPKAAVMVGKEKLQRFEKAKKAYNRDSKEYQDYVERLKNIEYEIREDIECAKRYIARGKFILKQYNNNLKLANGDESIAATFLLNMFKSDPQDREHMAKLGLNKLDTLIKEFELSLLADGLSTEESE